MEDETLTKRERKKLHKEESKQTSQQVQNKAFLRNVGIGVVIVALLGGAWLIFGNSSGSSPNTDTDTNQSTQSSEIVINENDHVKGNREAAVVLVEYADFQCPACAAYHPIMNELADSFGDDVAFVFRHMPLTSIHKNAEAAGYAAEAAGMQDKFWEMSDLLFERQEDWSNDRDPRAKFEGYASELGLDVEKFKTDSNSPEAKDRVRSDRQLALAARINATPTFFLNGEKITNPRGLEPFKELIQDAIGKAHAASPSPDATQSAAPEE